MNKPAPKSILDSLQHYAEISPNQLIYTILDKDCQETSNLTFAELYQAVLAVAYNLKALGLPEARPVALTATSGIEFIINFLGCLRARVIPVPLPSPRGKRQVERIKNIFYRHGFNTIIADADTAALMLDESDVNLIDSSSLSVDTPACELPEIAPDDVAFLQYTSGSTSQPKGVMVTHGNIISNEEQIYRGFRHNKDTVILGWLPFHHDMGLIGNMLHPIYAGVRSIVMSPMDFLRNPANWLRMISKYRATTSGGPNFAYDLCVAAVNPADLAGLDLSSWAVAFNGSEMIQERTLDSFTAKFKRFGFTKSAFQFCYGLAEATLYVTSSHFHDESTNVEQHKANIGCGTTEADAEVCIVDPQTHQVLDAAAEGEIWVSGSSVAAGYWKDPENTEKVFKAYTSDGRGPFMRTGDLGYLRDDNLFISGRLKNLIIIRGQNIHPIDIEVAIQDELPVLANYRSAIFSIRVDDKDQLVILHEVGKTQFDESQADEYYKKIVARISAEFQVEINTVAFLRENLLPRTTSGKIQIALARKLFLAQGLTYVAVRTLAPLAPTDLSQRSFDEVLKSLLNAPALDEQRALIEYGLDSIKAVQLTHLLEERYSLQLDLPEILNGISLAEIKTRIAQQAERATSSSAPAIERGAVSEVTLTEAPISFEQENIWIAQKLNPNDCSYNIPVMLKLSGVLDPTLLCQSLDDVFASYLSLNLAFVERQGAVYQQLLTSQRPAITVHDLRAEDHTQQQRHLQESFHADATRPFDLEAGHCYRAALYLCAADQAYLILNLHHIVCDGWSFGLFKNDLTAACNARLRGETPAFSDKLNRGVFEHAIEQRQGLDQNSERYWLDQLDGVSPAAALSPLWSNDTQAQSSALTQENPGDELSFSLSAEQTAKIKALGRQIGATPAAIFLSLYHCLLHHYQGDQNSLINYVGANRQAARYSQSFGCFVNTLVSRANFTADTSLLSLCRSVQQRLTENFKHEAYPFVELIRKSSGEQNANSSALSRYFFVMQNAPTAIDGIPGLSIDLVPQRTFYSMYDMVLEVLPLNDRFDIKLEYRTAVIPHALMEEYRQSFLALIDALALPEQPLAALQIGTLDLSPAVADEAALSGQTTFDVIAQFRQQAAVKAEKTALIDDTGKLSYQELLAQVDALSALIRQRVPAANGRVVLPCVRNNQYIISVLACLQAGACYVPLDFRQPAGVLEQLLQEVSPDLIIGPEPLKTIVGAHLDRYLSHQDLPQQGVFDVSQTSPRDQSAYIIFTSGSTGKPKGIMVSRGSLNSFVEQAIPLFDVTEADHVLQFSALNWDTSSEEIYPALCSGATLVLRGDAPVEHYAELLERSRRHQVSVWNLPSSYWQELNVYLQNQQISLPDSLRLIIIGGEGVSLQTIQRWYQRHGTRVRLLNTYGATELTSISMAFDLAEYAQSETRHLHVPIGRPLANTRAYILNDAGAQVPVGSIGQLHFAGPGLAQSYLNDPALTAEKFFIHPSLNQRVYNTGDYAYYDRNGVTYLVGRNDAYVKRRGVRVDLSLIAGAVADVDGVRLATADFQPRERAAGEINLYLVIDGNRLEATRQAVQQALSDRLGVMYQPDQVRYLTEVPRLPNGKLNLKVFRESAGPLFETGRKIKLNTATESKIAQIWRDVLGHDEFNELSAFNQVGGNSLLILQLKSRIEEEFKLDVSVSELFANSSCVKQAELIDSMLKTESLSDEQDIFDLLNALENDQVDLNTVKKSLNI